MQGVFLDGPLAQEFIPGLPDTVDELPQFLELPESVDDDPDEPIAPIPPGGEFPEMKFESHLYRFEAITSATIGNDPRSTQVIAHYRHVPQP